MGPNDLEAAAMRMLLAGDHQALAALRTQWSVAKVLSRTLTGVGFFTEFEVPSEAPRASLRAERLRLGDVEAVIPGLAHGAGFLLYLERGALSLLEGYTYDEPWPATVDGFRLAYHDEARSELDQLLRK